jgi:hypothetical protein
MTGGSSSSSESEEVEGRFACALEPGGAAGTGDGWTVAMITPYVSTRRRCTWSNASVRLQERLLEATDAMSVSGAFRNGNDTSEELASDFG